MRDATDGSRGQQWLSASLPNREAWREPTRCDGAAQTPVTNGPILRGEERRRQSSALLDCESFPAFAMTRARRGTGRNDGARPRTTP